MKRLANTIEDTRAFILRYVVLSDDQATACALWVLHTYLLEAADITPYLAITSAEKQCGKTVLLDVLDAVVHKPWRAVRPSEAVLFRKIERDRPTLLLDEVDAIWGPKSRSEDEGLRALLNAGFRRYGSTVPRCVGPSLKLRDFSTFCPKALAAIGDLPATIADRSIPIRMERKRRGDTAERWRWKLVQPGAEAMRESILDALDGLDGLSQNVYVDLPDQLSDRAQDAWEPLLAIADQAGGEWPVRARLAAISLMQNRGEEAPVGAKLLADIAECFNGDKMLPTTDLLDRLHRMEDAPWGDWYGRPLTGRKLASLLHPYRVAPRKESVVKTDKAKGQVRGYWAADFDDAWSRYTLCDKASEPSKPSRPATEAAS
jgi:hypothetical protein